MMTTRREWLRFGSTLLLFVASLNFFTNGAFPGDTYIHAHALYRLGTGALLIGCVLAAGRLRPVQAAYRRLDTLAAQVMAIPERLFVAGAALLFLAVTLLLSWVLFHHVPHITDSQSQYVGAKILASGRLYLPSEPLREFFGMQYMVNDGRFLSIFPPGHMLLLAAGHLVHAPWLVNPLLGAATLVILYLLARELGDASTARIALVLALCSPFLRYMSSEYMNHATTLFTCTLGLLAYIRTVRGKRVLPAIVCGASIGWALITRPQAALPFALPLALHAAWLLRSEWRALWKPALAGAAAFLAFVGFQLWYNVATMGDPLLMSYMVGSPNMVRLVASMSKLWSLSGWQLIGIDLERMLGQTAEVQEKLFEWPTYSLVFVGLLFLFRAGGQFSGLAMACCLSLVLSLLVNPWIGEIFGPRYLYETAGALIALTALGLQRTPGLLQQVTGLRAEPAVVRGGLIALLLLFTAISVPMRQIDTYRLYANHYYEGNYDYYQNIVNTVRKPALVFMRARKLEDAPPGEEWYYPEHRYVAFTLPVDNNAPVLFARDLRERNPELLKLYPDRHAYIADDTGAHPLVPGTPAN